MDGITDSAFRFIVKKYGNPDMMVTEFNHVMGMCIAGDNVMETFEYDESQRPIVGQIYGKEPEYFYHAAKIICALGFDAVDINMGCPAKNVAASGAGAGLIRTPELALDIIKAVKKGVEDWTIDGKITGLSNRSIKGFEEALKKKFDEISATQINMSLPNNGLNNLIATLSKREYAYKLKEFNAERKLIPVSVKTRIGYDKPITKEWISNIASANPEWLTVHGRTLKQLYTGEADWNELKIAVESTTLPVIVNGDIKNAEDYRKVMDLTNAFGAFIGRASYGNPWVFNTIKSPSTSISEPTIKERIDVMLELTRRFVELNPDPKLFFRMRKHFGWFIKGVEGSGEIRAKLMTTCSYSDVINVLDSFQY
jgi:tRNA-dihydrouridine synthase